MTIVIEKLEFKTILGILKKEREIPQRIIIDLEIDYEYKQNYLDYAKIVDSVILYIKENKFELVEDAVNKTCQMLGDTFSQISKITMKISKPDILENVQVGVQTTKIF